MSAEVHARALDAIRVRRAIIADASPAPWSHHGDGFLHEATGAQIGLTTETEDGATHDADLIQAAVNAFAADTDALAAVLERHAPSEHVHVDAPGGWCACCRLRAWPCPDAAAALRALGVEP